MEAVRFVKQSISVSLTTVDTLLSGAVATTGLVFTTKQATTTGNQTLLNDGVFGLPRGFTFTTAGLGLSRFQIVGKDGWGRSFDLEFQINNQAGDAAFTLPAKSIESVTVLFGNGATFSLDGNTNFGLKYPADFLPNSAYLPLFEAVASGGAEPYPQQPVGGFIVAGDGTWVPANFPVSSPGYGGQGIYIPPPGPGSGDPGFNAAIWYGARRLDNEDFRGPVV
jgi:hypothetical protein